jgi:chorismate mutase-like protein
LFSGDGVTQQVGSDSAPRLTPDDHALPVVDVESLAGLIDRRLSWMKDVAAYKWANDLPIEDLERERVVLARSAQGAARYGLDPSTVQRFVQSQMDLAKEIQSYWFRQWRQKSSPPPEFRDLTTEIRPDLLKLGDEILQTIARLAPWQHSGGALEALQPVFVDGISGEPLSYEQKAQLFRAVQAVSPTPK